MTNTNHNIVGYSYDVPIALMLPSPSYFLGNVRGHRFCLIRVEVGLGSLEFTTPRAFREGINQSDPRYHRIIVDAWNTTGDKMEGANILIDENSRALTYKRAQGVSYIEVILEIPPSTDVEAFRESGKDQASAILSQFLIGYRVYANDHNVPDFQAEDIPLIGAGVGTCAVSRVAGTDIAQFNIQYSNNKPVTQWQGIERHIKQPMAQDRLSAFENWLQGDMQIPEDQLLLLSALERAIWRKEYPSSVIFAQTGFEVFVSRFIRERAATRGITALPMPPRRGATPQQVPVNDALTRTLLNYKLRTLIPHITSATVDNTPEYNNWRNNAYRLRNEIVHAGRTNVSETDARNAFDSVNAFIARIMSIP
jgi:hypothetical protein